MDQDYIQILREWQDTIGRPALYENLDRVFPKYAFRRIQPRTPKDHWASRYKMDLSLPKRRNAEKTVVYRSDMTFREQGEWSDGISVVDKLMQDKGLKSVYEVFSLVDEMFFLDMPRPDSKKVMEMRSRSLERRKLLSSMRDYFMAALWDIGDRKASSVRNYLRSRGFTNEQIRNLSFGFVPSWNEVIRHFTLNEGYSIEDFEEACGVRSSDGQTVVGRIFTLAIPYVCAGEIRGFLFRRIGEWDGPKYLANRGLDRKSLFFNIPEKLTDGNIIVVEGEIDALKATSVNVGTVVSLGGSEISGERRKQIEDAFRRGVSRITLCLDLDADKDTGEADFASRHEHIMKSVHTIKDVNPSFEDIYIASLPEPTDPDQFIRERGAAAFKAVLEEASPYWKYLNDYMEAKLG